MKLLEWAYSKAITGIGGVDSAYKLGDDYLKTPGNLGEQVDRLIKWQVTSAATSGFMTGLGGFAIMPFTVPANVASVIYIQIRMIAAIAYMGGHDIRSDQVKTLVFVAMVGNGAKEILKDLGMRAGEKAVTELIKKTSVKTLQSINDKVGSGLASKLGSKGIGKLGKAIPFVGGIIGGTFDGASTNIIGKMAKRIFIDTNRDNIILAGEDMDFPVVQ